MDINFSQEYDRLLSINNNELEKTRKIKAPKFLLKKKDSKLTIKQSILITLIITFTVLLSAFIFLIKLNNPSVIIASVGIFCYSLIFVVIFGIRMMIKVCKYMELFEEKIIKPLVEKIENVKEYNINGKIDQSLYKLANFPD